MRKKKLVRVTAADISLNSLLRGQLNYLNQYYEVVGVAKDTGVLDEVTAREGIRVIDAPLERPIGVGKDIKALWFMWRLFRREKPWCIHANTPKGSLLAMVAAWAARVPNRIYTVTSLRYQATTGILRTILKTMKHVTCCYANQIIPEGEGVKQALRGDRITGKQLQVVYHGNINGRDTSYLSHKATGELLRAENGETRLMGDATPFDGRRYMHQKLGYTASDFVFILIARMVRDRGINELAEVMRRLVGHAADLPRQPKLLIVGEEEVQSGGHITLEAQRFLSESATVFCAGLQKDVRPYLMAADALVFPSYREGFPNVPMETGTMELPYIVTNINGCNGVIINGENGVIIPTPVDHYGHLIQFTSDDPQADGFSSPMAKALYQSMCDLINNTGNTNRMAANNRRLIQERYEQRDVWEALRQMYTGL